MNVNEILNTVRDKGIKCVAFDMFDTLVRRCVNPEYVKKIWAKQLCAKVLPTSDAASVYRLRQSIESELCKENAKDGYDLEFQYDFFLARLYEKISPEVSYEEFRATGIETEILTECRVQSLCDGVRDTLEALEKESVRCVCISDFYLSEDSLRSILDHHGIGRFFDRIYVSCDYLLTKRSGRLYEAVLREEDTPREQILMVGDNRVSDVENAEACGLPAIWIDCTEVHRRYEALWKEETTSDRVKTGILACMQPPQQSFFRNLTFSLYAFTQLLHEQLVRDHCKNVFFLSREGEFLRKIFDLYQEKNHFVGAERINTHYLIVSRKATFIPSLKPLEEEDFFVLFRQYRAISLFDFLSSLNFENKLITEIADTLQVDQMERQSDLPTSELFAKLKALPMFYEEYERVRTTQCRNFKRYLKQFGVDYENEGLHIVDVGWKGSIQDNLYQIFNGSIFVKGYYLGLVATGNLSNRNQKIGVLFQDCNNRVSSNFPIFNANRAIFEMVLAATHGSANGYFEENGTVKAATYYDPEEEKLYHTVIKDILEQIFVTFQKLTMLFAFSDIEYADYMVIITKIHAQMILYPTKTEINFFRNMYHYENFGVFEYTKFSKKKTNPLRSMKNLIRFVKSPGSILETGFWAPLTLEDAGLSFLKWPYAKYKMHKYRILLNGELSK